MISTSDQLRINLARSRLLKFSIDQLRSREQARLNKFDPNQTRDDHGRWSETGGGASSTEKEKEPKLFHGEYSLKQAGRFAREYWDILQAAKRLGYKPDQVIKAADFKQDRDSGRFDEAYRQIRWINRKARYAKGFSGIGTGLLVGFVFTGLGLAIFGPSVVAAAPAVSYISSLTLERLASHVVSKGYQKQTMDAATKLLEERRKELGIAKAEGKDPIIDTLEKIIAALSKAQLAKFDPNQTRDSHGRWSETSGGASASTSGSGAPASAAQKAEAKTLLQKTKKFYDRHIKDNVTLHELVDTAVLFAFGIVALILGSAVYTAIDIGIRGRGYHGSYARSFGAGVKQAFHGIFGSSGRRGGGSARDGGGGRDYRGRTTSEPPAQAKARMKHGARAAGVVGMYLRPGSPGEKAAAEAALKRMGINLKDLGLAETAASATTSSARRSTTFRNIFRSRTTARTSSGRSMVVAKALRKSLVGRYISDEEAQAIMDEVLRNLSAKDAELLIARLKKMFA